MNKEKWKKMKDFPDYDVSDQGQVRSWKNNRWGKRRKNPKILKPCLSTHGKKGKVKKVHHLVLETFIGPRPKGFETCHNNGKRTDNRSINLRWDSPKNNQADKIKHGTTNRGTRNHCCKLTEKQVLEIRKDPRILRLIANDYNICFQTIFDIKTHRTWTWLK